jgi:hypothetical protein
MLLLVKNEEYTLHIAGAPGVRTASRMHFIANTENVPVEPSNHQVLEITRGVPWELDFNVVPDTVAFDRLTVNMIAGGRKQGWLAYLIFVCDVKVMKGLKCVGKGV